MAAAPTTCTFRSFTPPEKLVDLKRAGYPTGLVMQSEFDQRVAKIIKANKLGAGR